MSEKTLLFIHMPKASGTTILDLLQRQYPAEQTFTIDAMHPEESIARFRAMAPEAKANLRCVKGLMPFGLHESMPQPCTYLTFLRDPVARIVSLFHFAQRATRDYLHPYVADGKMSLKDFVLSDLLEGTHHNAQTRILSGAKEAANQDSLERAKRNLCDHFGSVGFVERFEESIILCRRRFQWQPVRYRLMNASPQKKAPLEEEIVRLIQAKNHLDVELYRFARERFERDLASPEVQADLRALRWGNVLYRSNILLRKVRRKLLGRWLNP